MANENDYTPEGTGTNGLVKEGDDLKSSSKDTLGSYLSSVTAKNSFPIEDTGRIETSLRDDSTGQPAEFTTGGQDGNPGFTNTFPTGGSSSESAVSNFETLSDSGKIERLGDILNKNSRSDGSTLIRQIVSNREPGEPGIGDPGGASAIPSPVGQSPVQRKISSMLSTGNRFDPTPGSSPYIEDGRFTEPGIPIEQGLFGVYEDEAVRTSLEDLHKVAHSMLVRQTGHKLKPDQDPDSGSVVLPSRVQMGKAKVGTDRLRPLNAYLAPDRAALVNAELRYDDVTGAPLADQESYGALSSYREKFETGVMSNFNVAVGALSDYIIAAAIFSSIITLVETLEATRPAHQPTNPKTLKKGSYKQDGSVLRMMRAFGIPDLSRPTWQCAIYGFAAWLKLPASALPAARGPESEPSIPPPPIPSSGAGGWAAIAAWFAGIAAEGDSVLFNTLYSSGYYANTMRVVRRDLEALLSDIEFPSSGSAAGPDFARSIFTLLTKLNSYQSWTFWVSILRMGDAWLKSYNKYVRYNEIPVNGQTRFAHSRNPKSANGAMTWGHNNTPALLLLNEKYVAGARAYGLKGGKSASMFNAIGDPVARAEGTPYYGNLRGSEKDADGKVMGLAGRNRGLKNDRPFSKVRYSKEDVDLIENELDSEFCPFYFHDLRTNEVISFHAFLGDLRDSYAVNYADASGYGRIDSIKIYQNTTRTISLSFFLVSTNPQDFDSMYYSLNKLVSMIYPSFSMGKPVKAGNKKFVMPFSQIPTASPVIRLRVGDIVRSNYSRFNLARIFGISEIADATAGAVSAEDANAAPFDLVGGAKLDMSEEEKRAEDEAAKTDAENRAKSQMSQEPTSETDERYGYIPGSSEWGEAILKASNVGYTTYDTGPGKLVKLGTDRFPRNTYNMNEPPDTATHVEMGPYLSRPTADAKVKIFQRMLVGMYGGEAMNQETDDVKESPHAEYYVQYVDPNEAADPYGPTLSAKGHYHTYIVTSGDLIPIPPEAEKRAGEEKGGGTVTLEDQIEASEKFFDPANNAIVRSFEAAGGRGLAGVITSLDLDWGEAMWDMGGIGRRAPTLIKISIGFTPIHDIVPGLDNNGMMRSLNYPVGKIAGAMGTDSTKDPGAVRLARDPRAGRDAASDNYEGFAKSSKSFGDEGGTG